MDGSGPLSPGVAPVLLELGASVPDEPPGDPLRVIDEVQCALASVAFWSMRRGRRIEALARDADRLRERAERWLAAISDHPWARPFRPDRQAWVNTWSEDRPPPAAGFSPPGMEVGPSGPFALYGGFRTATLLDDGTLGPWPDEVRTSLGAPIWGLRLRDPPPRVLELRTERDWAALVERWPALMSREQLEPFEGVRLPAPLYGVDWRAAAEEWDGVRLTLDGGARLLFTLVPVLDGFTVLVSDVAFEETTWLRWVVESAELVGAWEGPIRWGWGR